MLPDSPVSMLQSRDADAAFLRRQLAPLQPYDFLCLGFADLDEGGVMIRRAALVEGGIHEDGARLMGQCALLLSAWRSIGHPLVVDLGPCDCVGARFFNRPPPGRIFALDGLALDERRIAFLTVSSPSWKLAQVDKALVHETLLAVVQRSRDEPEAAGNTAEPPPVPWRDEPVGFTPREIEIVHLVARGMTNKEIAQVLKLSPNTVRNHLRNLAGKTGCGRRAQLATLALRFEQITEG